jgi:hypothetical protein
MTLATTPLDSADPGQPPVTGVRDEEYPRP